VCYISTRVPGVLSAESPYGGLRSRNYQGHVQHRSRAGHARRPLNFSVTRVTTTLTIFYAHDLRSDEFLSVKETTAASLARKIESKLSEPLPTPDTEVSDGQGRERLAVCVRDWLPRVENKPSSSREYWLICPGGLVWIDSPKRTDWMYPLGQ